MAMEISTTHIFWVSGHLIYLIKILSFRVCEKFLRSVGPEPIVIMAENTWGDWGANPTSPNIFRLGNPKTSVGEAQENGDEKGDKYTVYRYSMNSRYI